MSSLAPETAARLARRQLRFAWWSLALFLSLGIALELLHGFKVPWYLNEAYATRRLMWTLAHAHGSLIALVNVAFVVALPWWSAPEARARLASQCLMAANLVLPAGFFLGGVQVYGGDPSPAIVLLPIGAALLLAAVVLVARSLGGHPISRA